MSLVSLTSETVTQYTVQTTARVILSRFSSLPKKYENMFFSMLKLAQNLDDPLNVVVGTDEETANAIKNMLENTGRRLVFNVPSRSRATTHTVTYWQGSGQWECSCEDFRLNNNPNCHHIKCARVGNTQGFPELHMD